MDFQGFTSIPGGFLAGFLVAINGMSLPSNQKLLLLAQLTAPSWTHGCCTPAKTSEVIFFAWHQMGAKTQPLIWD